MRAFHESAYGDDSVTELMKKVTGDVREIMAREARLEEERQERSQYVKDMQDRGRPMEIYFEEEMRQRSIQVLQSAVLGSHEHAFSFLSSCSLFFSF